MKTKVLTVLKRILAYFLVLVGLSILILLSSGSCRAIRPEWLWVRGRRKKR